MTKSTTAYLFPGQGAQYPGMGKDFFDSFAIAKETFQEADDLLQENLSRIIFEGPEDLLTKTLYSQLGIFVTSIAILRTVMQQMPGLTPFIAAGLSLGEYSALHASGKLGFKETLFLVQKRATFMNVACETTNGTMAAVLGINAAEIEKALQGSPEIWVANYNCPGQTVISGTVAGVDAAARLLKEKGAKRVIPLVVHGAFHSGLMQSAQESLTSFVLDAPIQDSSIHLVMNVPGTRVDSVEMIKDCLIRQVTHSIRWEQGIVAMAHEGVDRFIEMGCGRTLSGMNKKIGVSGETLSIEKVEHLELLGALCNC